MKKIICVSVFILSMIVLLNNVSRMAEGIRMRGFGGVNYGGVVFPLLIAIGAVRLLRKSKNWLEHAFWND